VKEMMRKTGSHEIMRMVQHAENLKSKGTSRHLKCGFLEKDIENIVDDEKNK